MAITATVSNHFKYMQATKEIDFEADTFKMILLDTTFAFNPDTHATLADVTGHQLATGSGYTQNDKVLAGVTVTEDDTNNRCSVTWTNVTWTASGGTIGPTGAAVIYDDTTADDTVIGCIDFGTDYSIADGSSLQFQNLAFYNN
jgi:hypothetical protein